MLLRSQRMLRSRWRPEELSHIDFQHCTAYGGRFGMASDLKSRLPIRPFRVSQYTLYPGHHGQHKRRNITLYSGILLYHLEISSSRKPTWNAAASRSSGQTTTTSSTQSTSRSTTARRGTTTARRSSRANRLWSCKLLRRLCLRSDSGRRIVHKGGIRGPRPKIRAMQIRAPKTLT